MAEGEINYDRPTEIVDEPEVTLIRSKNLITSKYAEDDYGCYKLVLDRYIPSIITSIDNNFCKLLQLSHKGRQSSTRSCINLTVRLLSIGLSRILLLM
jgi:hypothetical protein